MLGSQQARHCDLEFAQWKPFLRKHFRPACISANWCTAEQEPKQLNALFEKNYDLLLSIFNPDGWLEITFVDEQHRLGRDDKGNVFLLERMQ